MSWAPRVFWSDATVEPVGDGFTVRLDGRSVKTPAKADFVLPTRAMAEAAAIEWKAQAETVDPRTMPVTRAANAAIDKVAQQFDEVVDLLAAYADSDVTCYRAERPAALVARQAAIWDPLLDWAHTTFGARLIPVAGVMPQPQSPAALARLADPLSKLTAFQLTAIYDLISLSGSLVIGLAASRNVQPLDALWAASRLDELWQIEQWGEDEEASDLDRLRNQAFHQAAQFFHMAQGTTPPHEG